MTATSSHRRPADAAGPDIAEAKSRRRLARLLDQRERLAVSAAVFEAHHLGDVDEIRRVQYAVEDAVREEYPDVYDRSLGEWFEREASLTHDGTVPLIGCPVCDTREPQPKRTTPKTKVA
jgi:hypothetical protein